MRRIIGALAAARRRRIVSTLTLALVYSAVTPPSTLMLGRWLTLAPVRRDAVPLWRSRRRCRRGDRVGGRRFCLDYGVDFGAIREVVEDEDGPSRGASTIAMQTAKNVFLWPGRVLHAQGVRDPARAGAGRPLGQTADDGIYLNIAEWGDGHLRRGGGEPPWFGKDAAG